MTGDGVNDILAMKDADCSVAMASGSEAAAQAAQVVLLEPNKKRIKGHFLKNVLIKALPAGLTDVLAVGALVVCGEVFSLPKNDIATVSTMLLSVVGFMILTKISAPLNPLVFCEIFLHQLFAISEMSNICVLLLIVFSFAAESLFRYLTIGIEKLDELYRKIRQKKQ